MSEQSDTLQKLGNFAIFFNLFIFIIYIIISDDLTEIPVTFSIAGISINFAINLYILVIIIIAIFGVVALAGIGVFSTGFNDASTIMIFKIVSYATLWIMLSFFTLSFLDPLKLMGQLLWLIMSVIYSFSFVKQLSESD